MILTRERLTINPLEESATNMPLELAGDRAGHGLYVAKSGASYAPAATETPQLAQSVDTEGALAIATTIGTRASPIIKFAAIEPDDPAAVNYVANPQCLNAVGYGPTVASGVFEPYPIRDLVGFDYAIYMQCPGTNINEGLSTGVQSIPPTGGSWTAGVWLKGAAGGEPVSISAQSDGGTTLATAQIVLTNTWRWYTVSGTIAAGASTAWVNVTATLVNAQAFYATGFALVNAPGLAEYFDGTYPGCVWQGVPHGSSSSRPAPGGPRLNAIMADIEAAVTQISRFRTGTIRRITPTANGQPLRITYDLLNAQLSWDDSEYMAAGIAQGTITFLAEPYGRGPELAVTLDTFALWKADNYAIDATPVANLGQFQATGSAMVAQAGAGLTSETRILSQQSPYPLNSGEVSAQFTPATLSTSLANACTNPSFEYDALGAPPAGWTSGSSGSAVTVFAAQNGWATTGQKSLRLTGTGLGNVYAFSAPQAALPGQAWTASAIFNVAGPQSYPFLTIWCLNSIQQGFAGSSATVVGMTATGAQALTVTFPSLPAGTAYVVVKVAFQQDLPEAGPDGYVDSVLLAPAPVTAGYVDGDTGGSYSWSGTPGNSTTISGWKGGVVLERTTASTYMEAYVVDAATTSYLKVDKILAGKRTNVLTGALTRITPGTSYVVRARTQRQDKVDNVYAEYFANQTDPVAPATTPTLALGPYQITDSAYGALVPTAGGITIIPQSAGAKFDALRISPYLARERRLPVLRFGVCNIPGTAPALGRMIIQEDAGQSQRWCRWGQQGDELARLASAAATDMLMQAELLTPLNGASIGALTGASEGNALRSASLTATPVSMLSTRVASPGSEQAHVGFFGVYARVFAAALGTITLAWQWAQGDFLRWAYNAPVALAVNNAFSIVDLGEMTSSAVIAGPQQWRGQLFASSTHTGDQVWADYFFLVPLDDGGAEIQGVLAGDYAVFAGTQLEIRSNQANRNDAAATLWTPPTSYTGNYMRVPPPRYYDSVEQIVVKGSRGIPTGSDVYSTPSADGGIDPIEAQVNLMPRYAQIPNE